MCVFSAHEAVVCRSVCLIVCLVGGVHLEPLLSISYLGWEMERWRERLGWFGLIWIYNKRYGRYRDGSIL